MRRVAVITSDNGSVIHASGDMGTRQVAASNDRSREWNHAFAVKRLLQVCGMDARDIASATLGKSMVHVVTVDDGEAAG